MRKTMTAATTCLALLCCLPQHGMCSDVTDLAKEFAQKADTSDPAVALDQISRLKKDLASSEDPLAEGRAFLNSLVKELNALHGTSFTIQQICSFVRENLDAFQVPHEKRAEFLETLSLLEAEDSPQQRHFENERRFFKKLKKMAAITPGGIAAIILVSVAAIGVCAICPTAGPAAIAAVVEVATLAFNEKI